MGGNALKCGSIRMDQALYVDACETLLADCEDTLSEYYAKLAVVPSYFSKSDFGDIDIICYNPLGEHNPREILLRTLGITYGANEVVHNGNVTSFDLRCIGLGKPFEIPATEPAIQVDLIEFSDLSIFNFAYNYYSYNDLGNLLGRIAHNMGFKLGHDGLTYKFMYGTYLHEELVLSRSWLGAIEFLGYDVDRYVSGFDTLEDIFEFVASSQYFHPDIFLLENRDGESRRRDSKRKTYSAFLKWCEENKERLTKYEFNKDKTPYLIKAFREVKGFEENYRKCVHEVYVRQELKKDFNGSLIQEHVGFSGRMLGEFMKCVKASYNSEALFEQALLYNSDEVWARIYRMSDGFKEAWQE